MDEAERWFRAATRRYRGVSPFPLAMLDFQRGKLWMEHDDLRRARALVRRATSSPPAHPRQRHADGGDRGATIWRQPVTTTTYVADRTALLIPAIRAGRIQVIIVPHHRWREGGHKGWKRHPRRHYQGDKR